MVSKRVPTDSDRVMLWFQYACHEAVSNTVVSMCHGAVNKAVVSMCHDAVSNAVVSMRVLWCSQYCGGFNVS